MADLKFTKGTDKRHEIKLESHLIRASWLSGVAYSGRKAKFEVQTVFVGNGAKVKATGKSENGKKLGKVKGKMLNNVFVGEFDISDKIEIGDMVFFEVELSDNGLEGESNRIPVRPVPEIKNIKWSTDEARRSEIVNLSAELKKVPNHSEVKLVIYEFDRDGAHDIITELDAVVEDGKLDVDWEYEYHEDTDELPTKEEVEKYGGNYNPPEYFFTIKLDDFELGKEKQDSGILEFKDWMEISLIDDNGNPVPDVEYELTLPDGEKKTGNLDSEGKAKLENVPPGLCTIKYKNLVQAVDVTDISTEETTDENSPSAAEDEKLAQEASRAEEEDDQGDESQAEAEEDEDDDSQLPSSSFASSAHDFGGPEEEEMQI